MERASLILQVRAIDNNVGCCSKWEDKCDLFLFVKSLCVVRV